MFTLYTITGFSVVLIKRTIINRTRNIPKAKVTVQSDSELVAKIGELES